MDCRADLGGPPAPGRFGLLTDGYGSGHRAPPGRDIAGSLPPRPTRAGPRRLSCGRRTIRGSVEDTFGRTAGDLEGRRPSPNRPGITRLDPPNERRPPLGGSGGRLLVRLGGEESDQRARHEGRRRQCVPRRLLSQHRLGRHSQGTTQFARRRRKPWSEPASSTKPVAFPVSGPVNGRAAKAPGRPILTLWPAPPPPAAPRSSTWTRRSSRAPARLAFSRPFYAGGLITRRAVMRSAYAHFLFLAGRRRPRPDGADARLPVGPVRRLGRPAGPGHRRRGPRRADPARRLPRGDPR
jgi:hypothetical protein